MATKIDNLAQEIMEGLKEYADLASDDVKKAVRKAGNEVREEISASAPADTGKYAKSWTVKKTKETSNSLEVTVHSKNRYQLAHLLEHGHDLELLSLSADYILHIENGKIKDCYLLDDEGYIKLRNFFIQ